ncbi:MAG: DEAD/DEAH box helicase [Nitrospiraceae bacterium]|nr:DEAD/DEAH box helicase [Nitrospiraceae bacterium]
MESQSSLSDLIESLKKDRVIGPGITEIRHIPPKDATYAPLRIHPAVEAALRETGIKQLYAHQAEGISVVRSGCNVVVMTPTASGKSLIYSVPIIETLLHEPEAKALYISPLKGLGQDQAQKLGSLLRLVTGIEDEKKQTLRAEIYDGDTSAYRRKKIRENIPSVIFTNPDMLHYGLNAFHKKWEPFFSNLRYVVIDEIHAYRGVFGSNVAHILRRLRRICEYWGSRPQFIASSATIANPQDLASQLTGLEFSLVSAASAPQSGKYFIFLNPLDSPYTEATRIFTKCLEAGMRTILFTKARKITELIYKWSTERAPLLAESISPYRAGFLPSERREIEQRLFSGELSGVISTSALELGVDIGGLDACILCGYPGSVSSTWQRAGRVGRQGQESLVLMVALNDALDHYIAAHPDVFFDKPHEACICDPDNPEIQKRHLICAADEVHISSSESVYCTESASEMIAELEAETLLKRTKNKKVLYSKERMPHRSVWIRSIGTPLKLRDENYKIIGELDGRRIYRDAFPGAIYLHKGRQYIVKELDLESNHAICVETDAHYYTHALSHEDVEVLGRPERVPAGRSRDVQFYQGRIRINYQVTGYDQKNIYDGTRIARHSVDMPEYVFETDAIWMMIERSLADTIRQKKYDLAGTMHAAEHVLINTIPLFALCDKGDLGGMSYAIYPETESPAIFIYDGFEGGMGLSRRALEVPHMWIDSSLSIMRECGCESGCPACVQDSQCGSANNPLDKDGAVYFLNYLLEDEMI